MYGLREYRKEKGYTQTEIAQAIGVKQAKISDYENGVHSKKLEDKLIVMFPKVKEFPYLEREGIHEGKLLHEAMRVNGIKMSDLATELGVTTMAVKKYYKSRSLNDRVKNVLINVYNVDIFKQNDETFLKDRITFLEDQIKQKDKIIEKLIKLIP